MLLASSSSLPAPWGAPNKSKDGQLLTDRSGLGGISISKKWTTSALLIILQTRSINPVIQAAPCSRKKKSQSSLHWNSTIAYCGSIDTCAFPSLNHTLSEPKDLHTTTCLSFAVLIHGSVYRCARGVNQVTCTQVQL